MDTLPGVEMQDYWNEVQTLRRVKKESFTDDHHDDGDADTSFFENLGLSISTSSQELSEDNTERLFMGTLTPRQEEVLKRRVETLNATLRQKRHKLKPPKPDIRNLFGSTDASSTGTRSRSETPDSLDSVSPPHTPPNPTGWSDPYLSRSRGSLDSGNHSLVTVPYYQPTPPTLVTVTSYQAPPTLVTISSNSAPNTSYIVNSSPTENTYTHRGTSIVTISNNGSDGSVSPLGSNDSLSPPGRSGKYSCTYISNDNIDSNNDTRLNVTTSGSSSPSDTNHSYHTTKRFGYIEDEVDSVYNRGYTRNTSQSAKTKSYRRHKDNISHVDIKSSTEEENDSSSEYNNSDAHRYVHYPNGRVTIKRAPSLDSLQRAQLSSSRDRIEEERNVARLRRQRSYAKEVNQGHKFYNKQKLYEFKPTTIGHSSEGTNEVQVLKYNHIGSLHAHKPKEKRPSLPFSEIEVHGTTIDEVPDLPKDPPMRSRSSSTTDCGFIVLGGAVGDGGSFPDLKLQVGRSGQTRMDWLHEADLTKLKSLALLELEILFGDNHINHRWRSGKRRRPKDSERGVFGVSLQTLLDKDASLFSETYQPSNVPMVLSKLISQLEVHGIQEEGILRVPGNSSKTEHLRGVLDANFYSSPSLSDEALRQANPNDVVACIKLFLRLLPEPLFTHAHLLAFHKTHRIKSLEDRIASLTMLLLLLPTPHRDTLRALLSLCSSVVANESSNRMGLYNVATIIAPNLFPPPNGGKSKVKEETKEQMLQYAHASCSLSQLLIKYQEILWSVPQRLMGQIRKQNPKHSNQISRFLHRKTKDTAVDSSVAVLSDNCEVKVHAPQFNRQPINVNLNHSIHVRDLLTRLFEEHSSKSSGVSGSRVEGNGVNGSRVEGRRELKGTDTCPRHSEGTLRLSPSSYTCLLRGAKHALGTHALHEKGGNITERRLDPGALLLAIHQDNLTAEYLLKCHHPGGLSSTYEL